jgi:hypothetical protein
MVVAYIIYEGERIERREKDRREKNRRERGRRKGHACSSFQLVALTTVA